MRKSTKKETFATMLAAYRNIRKIIAAYIASGAETIIISINEYDFESGRRFVTTERIELDAEKQLSRNVRDYWNKLTEYGDLSFEAIAEIKNHSEIMDSIVDLFDDGANWETEKAYNIRKTEQQRRKLEQHASKIARAHGCEVDSVAFIEACNNELERFSTYRDGMREDGLCIGYGVSPSQWHEEYNDSCGDSEQIYEILEWLASECPLLWAKYQNSLKEAETKTDITA